MLPGKQRRRRFLGSGRGFAVHFLPEDSSYFDCAQTRTFQHVSTVTRLCHVLATHSEAGDGEAKDS